MWYCLFLCILDQFPTAFERCQNLGSKFSGCYVTVQMTFLCRSRDFKNKNCMRAGKNMHDMASFTLVFTWSTMYVDGDEEGAWRRCWWWWQCCCRVHCLYPFIDNFWLKRYPFHIPCIEKWYPFNISIKKNKSLNWGGLLIIYHF